MTYTFVDEQFWEEHDSMHGLGAISKSRTPGTPSALPLLPGLWRQLMRLSSF